MGVEQAFERERAAVAENLKRQAAALESMRGEILQAATLLQSCLKGGGKVLFFGNGGSAADAQHWAAELAGRYVKERPGLAGLALTTDTSAITAIANDYGYDQVFSRQMEALARPGDVAVGISTSGNSPSVRFALQKARSLGCFTLAVLGRDGGAIGPEVDLALVYPARETARIQEFHAVLGHILCALAEAEE